MKKIFLFASGIVFSALAFAQQQDLAPDQNPNYAVAMVKYTGNTEQLQSTNNTTVQNTYKAFDWYENKKEKKQERLEFNRKIRLLQAERSYYNRNNYNGYGYDRNYNNGYNRNYNYNYWHW